MSPDSGFRLPPPVTRFAPAPTGRLHLGHVVNAIYVWGVTKAAGGSVLLRVEDHDRQRSRREYEQALLEDLEWLGFVPDDPPVAAFRGGRCHGRQSDRGALYESALNVLRRAGRVYACDCSRADVFRASGEGAELRYPGTCRELQLPEVPGRGVRVRLDNGVERFDDLRHGPQAQRPLDQCGDLLVRDRDGNWTYQFVASVDDFDQGVTLVIRGDDLLASTGRQLQVARLLGRPSPPRFLHHSLVMKSPTQKLSKADGDTSVGDLRASGLTATEVIGCAASLVGLTDREASLATADVAHLPPLVRLASTLSALGRV
ncbi:MAG: tRNA glutamyl-Q(34) synthetase GluQRS [Acidimicrobiia bacterium]|nr:tRNA glutamyl-Q(34) synthetase GluQRS [Acidimicrobiia bacterium]